MFITPKLHFNPFSSFDFVMLGNSFFVTGELLSIMLLKPFILQGGCFVLTLCVFESELPSTRGEDLQAKCLLELYGLKVSSLLDVLIDRCCYVTLFELLYL